MADEALGTQDASTEQAQSVEDFIGSILDAPDETNAPEKAEGAAPAKADESAPETEIAGPETDPGETDDTDEEREPEAKPSTVAAPQSMSAKDREWFAKLPPESQKWLTDREQQMTADYTRKNMATAEKGKQYEQLDRVLAPHRQKFAHMGATEAQAIGQLLMLAEHADRDFVGFVQEQARLRGLPLAAFTQPGHQADPQTIATQQRLQGIENHLRQQQANQHEQQLKSVETVLSDFVNEKAQDGTPAFPYYAELEDDMIAKVGALRVEKPGLTHRQYLEIAYKRAVAESETVSAKVEAEKKAKAEAARIERAKKEAADAKKAAGTQPKSSGALPPSIAKTRNIDEFIGGLVDERMRA